VRKLQAMIEATQAEIETYDLGAAAKAKANFEQQYSVEKQKETNLHAKVSGCL
jgi:DNA repair protein RAD50